MSAAATLLLTCDIVEKKLLYSITSPAAFSIPSFTQGDIVPVIFTVAQFRGVRGQASASYAKPSIENLDLQFTLCDDPSVDPGGATPFVTQFSWTKDTVAQTFKADIAFNTGALNTWLTTPSSRISNIGMIRFKLIEGGNSQEIYRDSVTVYRANSSIGAVAAGETPLSYERAMNTFVSQKPPGTTESSRILRSAGGKQFREWIDEDGQPHYSPIL